MSVLRVRATANGRVVRWSDFKQGRLVDSGGLAWMTTFTTVLTNVVADLCEIAESFDKDFRIVTMFPNGVTTTSYDMALIGDGFEIACGRRLVRGLFPLNPLAPEFGANFDVLVSLAGSSDRFTSAVMTMLNSKYEYQSAA